MFQFLFGVTLGVWLGTKYDCKPYIDMIAKLIAENTPKRTISVNDIAYNIESNIIIYF